MKISVGDIICRRKTLAPAYIVFRVTEKYYKCFACTPHEFRLCVESFVGRAKVSRYIPVDYGIEFTYNKEFFENRSVRRSFDFIKPNKAYGYIEKHPLFDADIWNDAKMRMIIDHNFRYKLPIKNKYRTKDPEKTKVEIIEVNGEKAYAPRLQNVKWVVTRRKNLYEKQLAENPEMEYEEQYLDQNITSQEYNPPSEHTL